MSALSLSMTHSMTHPTTYFFGDQQNYNLFFIRITFYLFFVVAKNVFSLQVLESSSRPREDSKMGRNNNNNNNNNALSGRRG
jgi:hypothetical protein